MRLSPLQAFAVAGILLGSPAFAQTSAPGSAAAGTEAHGTLIDINTASKGELTELPQIGPAQAAAIMKGRPYRETSDLVAKKIVPRSTFEAIKERITIEQHS